MLAITLRPPDEFDWPSILAVAHGAAPWAAGGNDVWLAARQNFDETTGTRRHYVAEDASDRIVGYGAIEATGATPGQYRLFVVMAPEPLHGGLGDEVLATLMSDLDEVNGTSAWMREEARDAELRAFASAHGFVETSRFAADDLDIVVLELSRGPTGFSGVRG